MAMIRPKGKPNKIAQTVLKGKGVKVPSGGARDDKIKDKGPFLLH
jgi:hypothetical protein